MNNKMEKNYITSDKIGEFVQRMYEKGIKAEANPEKMEICVTLGAGRYEWIKIFTKSSFEELCGKFGTENQEA